LIKTIFVPEGKGSTPVKPAPEPVNKVAETSPLLLRLILPEPATKA